MKFILMTSKIALLTIFMSFAFWVKAKTAINLIQKSGDTEKKPQIQMRAEEKIAQLIRKELALKMNEPEDNFRVKFEPKTSMLAFAAIDPGKMELAGFGAEGSKNLVGLVSLNIVNNQGSQFESSVVSGVVEVQGPVFMAKENLLRERVVGEEQIQKVIMPWKTLAPGTFGFSKTQVVGKKIKSLVESGMPFQIHNLELAPDVKTGDFVELTLYSGPGVMIRSRAIARGDGRVGDSISIEQPETKKKLSGTVVGPKAVEVEL